MSIDFDDIGDVMHLQDVESVFSGVMSHPFLKGVCALALWACTALGVPIDLAFAMAILFVADFIVGCAFSMSRGRFTCRKFMRGIAKVPVYTLLLVIAWLCQNTCKTVLGQDIPVPMWTAAYLAMHDALSIIGKCDAMGLPVPSLIKRAMRRINSAAESCVDTALDKLDKDGKGKDNPFSKF